MLPSIPTSSAWLVALLKQLVENESGKFPGVYSCPFNLHLTNPPQVREPTCGVCSSGSRGSTNTAVQIWHTGFLISYLLAGQAAVSFQGRITHYCLAGKEQVREKKKGKIFQRFIKLAFLLSKPSDSEVLQVVCALLCTQSSFGVCDYSWSLWNFIKIPNRSGCVENLPFF